MFILCFSTILSFLTIWGEFGSTTVPFD